jgi:hypothetical protein
LWQNVNNEIFGEKIRRRDSNSRSEKEAHLYDIITALLKLDKTDNPPTVLIDALSLKKIPRSHPEELNNISLVDRLNQFEARMSNMQSLIDQVMTENHSLKDQVNDLSNKQQHKSYSSVASTSTTNSANNTRTQASGVVSSQKVSASSTIPAIKVDEQFSDASTHSSFQQGPFAFPNVRGRGRGTWPRGASLRGAHSVGQSHSLHLPPSIFPPSDSISQDRSSNRSDTGSGFEIPSYHKKKARKVITGKVKGEGAKVRGAPEPSRHLFIYRVDKSVNDSDMKDYVNEQGVTIQSLACVSHPSAKYKSFKLTVPISEYERLFSDEMWPEGIRVRKYIPPRPASFE